jgi:hypothetical protein
MAANTTAETAAPKTATPRKRASRSKAPQGVSLTRSTPKLSTAHTADYSGFCRALLNMGEAADSATTVDKDGNTVPSVPARRYYAGKRDELLNTFVQSL